MKFIHCEIGFPVCFGGGFQPWFHGT